LAGGLTTEPELEAELNGKLNLAVWAFPERVPQLLEAGEFPQPEAVNLAVRAGDTATLKTLIDTGADINQRGGLGCAWTPELPLEVAVRVNAVPSARCLVEAGASTRDVGHHGEKPVPLLWIAADCGHLDMAKFLIEHGAPDEARESALLTAIEHGFTDLARFLIECDTTGPWLNRVFAIVCTPLGFESKCSNADLQSLLDEMIALIEPNTGTRKPKAGSRAREVEERIPGTPLLAAVGSGKPHLVELLLQKGADPTLAGHDPGLGGCRLSDRCEVAPSTPLEVAHDRGNQEIAALIEAAISDCA
jgi:ankyrin repeat protein